MPKRPLRIALFALLVLETIAATGCGIGPVHEADVWTANGAIAAPATLHIKNLNGPINVRPSADGEFHATAHARWRRGEPRRDVTFQQLSSGSDVTLCATWGGGSCTGNSYSVHVNPFDKMFKRGTDAVVAFDIQVPAGVQVDATTINGAVTVLATAPVKAATTNGAVRVGTSVGPVSAQTLNGDVDIRMTTLAAEGKVSATSLNGSVVAYVPEITDGDVRLSTANGKIGSDFGDVPVTNGRRERDAHYMLGAASRKYELNSVNGSVYLRIINADGTVANARATPVSASTESRAVPTKSK